LPAYYEIRVDGVLDHRWAAWFGGLHVETDGTQTVISGLLTDQPALHGLLVKIRRLPGSQAGNQARPSDSDPAGNR